MSPGLHSRVTVNTVVIFRHHKTSPMKPYQYCLDILSSCSSAVWNRSGYTAFTLAVRCQYPV